MEIKKVTQVHFSPSGTTRKTAEALSESFGLPVDDADLLHDPSVTRRFDVDELVIFCLPVFAGRLPEFCPKLLSQFTGSDTPALAVVVYGNRDYEDALLELDDCLKAQGFRIGAGTALLAEHSMVRDVAAGRPDGRDQKEMADFAAKILEKLEGDGWQEPQVPGNRPYRDWKQMPVIPLTNASCISCGLCAARCPVQAIPVSNPSSTDQSRCILCMRCISVCPMKARSLPEQACAMLEQKLSPVRDIRRENELFL